MSTQSSRKAIVVLGVHPAVRKVLNSGLKVLGVELDESLVPHTTYPEKGLPANAGVNALSVEMLGAIDSDPYRTPAIGRSELEGIRKDFFSRAVEIVKTSSSSFVIGFKDHRFAQLLPFWLDVFEHCQLDVHCLLIICDPMSMAGVLPNDSGIIEVERSYLIWLTHVLAYLDVSAGTKRLVVDYDRLVQSPEREISRVAHSVGLLVDAVELNKCKAEYREIVRELGSSDSRQMQLNKSIPPLVKDGYTTLRSLATEQSVFDELAAQEQLARWAKEVAWSQPMLRLIDHFSAKAISLDSQIADLHNVLAVRDQQIAHRDEELKALYNSLSWRTTARLRFIAGYGRRSITLVRSIPAWLKSTGGVTSAIVNAVMVYRAHGVAGIKRGVAVLASGRFIRNNYQRWINRYDSLDEPSRERIRKKIGQFACTPKISVVMPVFDASLELLDKAIWSVRNQLYPEWEICIADDGASSQAVRNLLKAHAEEDSRIKVVIGQEKAGIVATSNVALDLATGEYVAFFNNSDLLPEHSLFCVANTISEYTDTDVIYSDEDKIDITGRRYDPYFKCDLNKELLLSQNMLCHLTVYRRQLLQKVGGFRVGFEGAQDYDLALRVIEQSSPCRVKHIPRVLYHWRDLGSTEQSFSPEASRRAVAEHLERTGVSAEVFPAPEAPSFNRVRFSLPNPLPLVSIIIPTRDHADLLELCVKSVLETTTYPLFEIIIIDNGSVELETMLLFEQLPKDRVTVVRDDSPFNFSALNNSGVRAAKGELLCLMNNDIEIITPDWLEEMVSFAAQPGVGCVGARLWYPNRHLQHGGVVLVGGVAGHAHKHLGRGQVGYFHRAILHQSFSAVTAACLVVRRSVFDEVGGLDESLAVAFNDVDFCLRVRESGYRNVWTPYAEMVHHESVSRGYEDNPEKQARFAREVAFMKARWGTLLQNDPAYSPNLALYHEDFSLAWPPRVEPL